MSNEQQVGNADQAPESTTAQDTVMGAVSDDFFAELDNSVNSGIIDEPLPSTSNINSDNTLSSPSEVQTGEQQENVESLQKRYSDSSREARRLNSQVQEMEPYLPILEAMRDDPNLITHVRNYFEGGGQTPQNMAEKLKLPEDFVFDADDAFSTPDSDSAKVLGATIDGIVQRRLGKELRGQRTENQKLAKETSFRQKHNISDDEWDVFVDFAKSKSLELEDIYYLMNRSNRDEKIASSARQEVHDKMREVEKLPSSLATTGGTQVEESPDDRVFEAILGSDSELEKAFGM
jgi:hypothetical protein